MTGPRAIRGCIDCRRIDIRPDINHRCMDCAARVSQPYDELAAQFRELTADYERLERCFNNLSASIRENELTRHRRPWWRRLLSRRFGMRPAETEHPDG